MTRTRAIWLMVPAGAVDQAIAELVPRLAVGDTVIDGGNSYCRDDIRRAGNMAAASLHHIDVGTRGGVAGQERGHCLMIGGGGDGDVVNRLKPILTAMKGVLVNRLTTVFPRQRHYALDPVDASLHPAADVTIECIGDLVDVDAATLRFAYPVTKFGEAMESTSLFDPTCSASLTGFWSARSKAVASHSLEAPTNAIRCFAMHNEYTLQSCEPINEAKRSASRSCHGRARHWAKLTVRDRRKSSSKIRVCCAANWASRMFSVASSLSWNERLSKLVEPTDTSRPSTIITLQWYIVG